MFSHISAIFYIFLSSIACSESSRILAIFPVPSISHQVVFRALTQELAKRGHELVIVTPDPAYPKGQEPENVREIEVHEVSYNIWSRLFNLTSSGDKNELVHQIKSLHKVIFEVIEADLHNEELREIVFGDHNFDLILLEFCSISILSLTHIFKAPVIQITSLGNVFGSDEVMGSAIQQLLYPSFKRRRLYNLTLLEKFQELYMKNMLDIYHNSLEDEQMISLRQYFGPSLPSYNELKNNVDMLFLNSHPIWEDNRPVPPGVVYMGGLPKKPARKLPDEWQFFLDSSRNGVIYFSFGTNMKPSMMSPEKIQIFMTVFSKLPYEVIWKSDTDVLIGRPENVRISKWLPQSDLLRHPKIKLFITQGGLQSIDEAIVAGVPMIGIPFFADQWYNTEKIVHHNIGLQLDMPTLTEAKLMNSIQTIVRDNSYRDNVSRFRSLLYDRPQESLERAVWWTEYVLRHTGAKHLRAPAANMPWSQYVELDLVVLLLAVLISVSLFVCFVVNKLWGYIEHNYVAVIKFRRTYVYL